MDLSRFMFMVDRFTREPAADPLLKQALNGLRTDWRDVDPGKHGPNWFFVRVYLLENYLSGVLKRPVDVERFWVDLVVDDLPAARLGREPAHQRSGTQQRVPVPLGEFKDVRRFTCDSHGSAWVVGKYEQTLDGPDGDVWQADLYLLCPSCPKLHHLASRSEGRRFM